METAAEKRRRIEAEIRAGRLDSWTEDVLGERPVVPGSKEDKLAKLAAEDLRREMGEAVMKPLASSHDHGIYPEDLVQVDFDANEMVVSLAGAPGVEEKLLPHEQPAKAWEEDVRQNVAAENIFHQPLNELEMAAEELMRAFREYHRHNPLTPEFFIFKGELLKAVANA